MAYPSKFDRTTFFAWTACVILQSSRFTVSIKTKNNQNLKTWQSERTLQNSHHLLRLNEQTKMQIVLVCRQRAFITSEEYADRILALPSNHAFSFGIHFANSNWPKKHLGKKFVWNCYSRRMYVTRSDHPSPTNAMSRSLTKTNTPQHQLEIPTLVAPSREIAVDWFLKTVPRRWF